MESGILIVVFILFAILVVGSMIVGRKKAEERRAALRQWAASHKRYFQQEKVRGFDAQHPGLRILQQGSNRYAYNIAAGPWNGFEVTTFDYHYQKTSGSGKDRKTRHFHFTGVLLQPDFPLKSLLIRREGVFDKIASGFGFDDINFESAAFSDRFHVSAKDRKWAYDALPPETIELILNNDAYSYECDNQVLALTMSRKRMNPPQLEYALDLGAKILNSIPDFAKHTS